jgi:hypothetical protein
VVESIVAQVTSMQSQHVTDLRLALVEVDARIPRLPPLFTDPVIVPGVSPVRTAHIQDVRSAIIALE